jgi:hypothetical protein
MERRKFTKEEIVVWISKYKYGNINDLDYQKEIIDTFVNSVYVYDDKIVLTYNYKDGSQTLTLQEIESALSSHLTSLCPPRKTELFGVRFFISTEKEPRRIGVWALSLSRKRIRISSEDRRKQ